MKQRILITIALISILAACIPEVSRSVKSPLARPHIIFEMRDVGAVYSPLHRANLPFVSSPPGPCNMNVTSTEVSSLFLNDAGQHRVNARCDTSLVKAAQHRADDMATRGYFSHNDPEGHTPNYWARTLGCRLPDWYPVEGNQIESIALNYPTAAEAWAAWLSSPGHRVHVLGELDFYAQQIVYGVGVSRSAWGTTYVLMSSPSC